MKNMFTRPEECFSRQEATSVFRERGLWGPVDIGVVRTLSDKYVVWHCCSEGKEAAISIFKEQSPENILEIQYFTAFAREDVFMLQNNFYYIDQNDELQRIDVLFDASLASAVYEIITDLNVESIEIGLAYPEFADDNEAICCWIINGNKILPIFKDDFSLIEEEVSYYFSLLNLDDIFDHNRVLWKVENGEEGMEISPLCVTPSFKTRNPWSNIS